MMRLISWCLAISACTVTYTIDDGAASSGSESGTGEGQDDCDPLIACDGGCIDPASDPSHCGACGSACAEGQVCNGSSCSSSCTDERVSCDAACVDLDEDPRHCGACDRACSTGETCHEGQCRATCETSCTDLALTCIEGVCRCREGLDQCDGRCVDLQSDPLHCGGCGENCGSVPCGEGECRPEGCGEGQELCDNSCVDLAEHPLHCGACELACAPEQRCEGGVCLAETDP